MKLFLLLSLFLFCCKTTEANQPGKPEEHPPASIFYVPKAIPLHTPIVFAVCDIEQKSPLELYADDQYLGWMVLNKKSNCLQLIYPGFNTPGRREIKTDKWNKVIWVFQH